MTKNNLNRPSSDDDSILFPILIAVLSCIILFLVGVIGVGVWRTANSRAIESEPPPVEENHSEPQIKTIAQDGSVVYNLPCGMELTYYDSVPGDTTGKCRVSTTSFGASPSNYAAEYYKHVFSSDDEIHAICDPTLGTTTRIKVEQGLLIVDTMKYVDGDEKDAKILFSGDVLRSKVFDRETGKSVKVGKDVKPSPEASPSPSPSVKPSPSVTPSESPSVKPPESQTPTPSSTPQPPAGNDRESKFASGRVLATTESDNNGNPVYHTRNCTAAKKIAEESELWYESEQAAEAASRDLCGICGR